MEQRRTEMSKEDILRKLTSRKFWICVAAFLGSVAASITGLAIENNVIAGIGMACGVISAGVYAALEASVDKARLDKSEN